MTADNFIIFMHIHKCAGLSFKRVLRGHYGPSIPRRILNRVRGIGPVPLPEAMAKTQHRDRYFAGHFGFGVHECLPGPSQYVTFLREPKQRLISLYEYSRDTPLSFYHEQAVGRSFREFVESGDVFECDNGMVRFLIGDESKTDYYVCRRNFGCIGEAEQKIAINNLEQHFLTPGLTERFDESMVLLRGLLGLRSVVYLKLNERPRGRGPRTEWDPALERFISQDQIVYEWAVKQHEIAWHQTLKNNPDALETFLSDLAAYQKRWKNTYSVYKTFRSWTLDSATVLRRLSGN